MKTIELKRLETIKPDGSPTVLDYKIQLEGIMRAPLDPSRGADIEEIRNSIRVLDVLSKAKDKLVLEDADYEYMCRKVNAARYILASPAVIQFVDDVVGGQVRG